jgi:hypothetical protein
MLSHRAGLVVSRTELRGFGRTRFPAQHYAAGTSSRWSNMEINRGGAQ